MKPAHIKELLVNPAEVYIPRRTAASFDIEPIGKPRMTRSDKWKKRSAVLAYRAFADELRLKAAAAGLRFPESGAHIVFRVPMPNSWSLKKRAAMAGKPHQVRPDVDNMVKAVLDALLPDNDSRVWSISAEKLWAPLGRIEILETK